MLEARSRAGGPFAAVTLAVGGRRSLACAQGAADTKGISVFRSGVLHAERLVNVKRHNYHLESNVRFSPDLKWVIFRSSMFDPSYVLAVEVAKAQQNKEQ